MPDICPDINNLPTLDPKDAWLASETAPPPSTYANNHASSSYATPAKATPSTTYVPWLRRTEYISREATHRSSSNMDACVALYCQFQYPHAYFVETENRKRRLMSPFPPKLPPLKLPSLPHQNLSTFRKSNILGSHTSNLSTPGIFCRMPSSGETLTIYSNFQSDLVIDHWMYVRHLFLLILC